MGQWGDKKGLAQSGRAACNRLQAAISPSDRSRGWRTSMLMGKSHTPGSLTVRLKRSFGEVHGRHQHQQHGPLRLRHAEPPGEDAGRVEGGAAYAGHRQGARRRRHGGQGAGGGRGARLRGDLRRDGHQPGRALGEGCGGGLSRGELRWPGGAGRRLAHGPGQGGGDPGHARGRAGDLRRHPAGLAPHRQGGAAHRHSHDGGHGVGRSPPAPS